MGEDLPDRGSWRARGTRKWLERCAHLNSEAPRAQQLFEMIVNGFLGQAVPVKAASKTLASVYAAASTCRTVQSMLKCTPRVCDLNLQADFSEERISCDSFHSPLYRIAFDAQLDR